MPRIIEIFHIGIIATVHLLRVDACQYQYWFFFVKNSGFLPFLKTMPILILGCLAKVTKFQFYKTDEYQYWVVYEYCVFFCFFFFAPILILGIERAAWNWTHLANRSNIHATHFGRLRTHIEICEKWANINIDIWSSNRFFYIKEKRANINIDTCKKNGQSQVCQVTKKNGGFFVWLYISNLLPK